MNEIDSASAAAAEQAKTIIEEVFSELAVTVNSDAGKFFPKGIGLIELEVSIGGKDEPLLHVKCKVDGVKPSQSEKPHAGEEPGPSPQGLAPA